MDRKWIVPAMHLSMTEYQNWIQRGTDLVISVQCPCSSKVELDITNEMLPTKTCDNCGRKFQAQIIVGMRPKG
jgi:hypothetical protein